MANKIPRPFIDELITRVDLVELIGARIALKKTGANFSALCPFHTEKSPSFTVSPTKQFYYCFGCSAHGNAISFLMEFDRMGFIEAVETLASQVGLEIPRDAEDDEKQQYNKDFYAVLQQASQRYQQQLRATDKAINYLKSRGVSGKVCKQYAVGYAPPGWDFLMKALGNHPKALSQLTTTGMLLSKNGKSYDRFRDRIMFPIHDSRGRVIAFGGRTLGDEKPKYLNSPETPVYHKGDELYGLYEAKKSQRQLSRILIVEGYMDVIVLAEHGITYAVATLGTATTTRHVQRLLRHTTDILFCFDGDDAGKSAAWRALENTLPLMRDGVHVRFMFLPEGEDPDSLVRAEDKTAFEARMNQAMNLSDFFFSHLSDSDDNQSIDSKAKLAKRAMAYLNKIPTGVFQQLMFERLGEEIHMEAATLKRLSDDTKTDGESARNKRATKKTIRAPSPVRLAITYLLHQPQLVSEIDELGSLETLKSPGMPMLRTLLSILRANPTLTTGALLEHWENPKEAHQLAKLAAQESILSPTAMKTEFLGTLQRLFTLAREQEIQQLLTKASDNQLSQPEKQRLQTLITAN